MPAVTVKDAVPVLDALPVATDVHTPDFTTCNATARPARTGPKRSVAVAVVAASKVAGIDSDADCATTLRVLAAVTYSARTLPATVTLGANARTAYDPTIGARKLVAYEPVLAVVALARVTQLVPDLRWTHTGREETPGSFPLTFTLSAPIADAGASRTYGACAATNFDAETTAAAPCQDNATAR